MADSKISDLLALATVLTTDIVPIVSDPGGSPVTKKATVLALLKAAIGTRVFVHYHDVSNSSATSPMKFSTQIVDTHSSYVAATGLWTVPAGQGGVYNGVVRFPANATTSASGTAPELDIIMIVNGVSKMLNNSRYPYSHEYPAIIAPFTRTFAAGDVVQWQIGVVNMGGAVSADDYQTGAYLTLVGPL